MRSSSDLNDDKLQETEPAFMDKLKALRLELTAFAEDIATGAVATAASGTNEVIFRSELRQASGNRTRVHGQVEGAAARAHRIRGRYRHWRGRHRGVGDQ